MAKLGHFLGLRRGGGVGGRNQRDQILQRSIVEPKSYKLKGPKTYNLKIWLSQSGNLGWDYWRTCSAMEKLRLLLSTDKSA